MATLNPIQESPNPVPAGQAGTITLTFVVNPGHPDMTAAVSVYDSGTLVASSSAITLKGAPAETTPVVLAGSTNTGWEIRTDHGVLVAQGNNTFALSYS